MTYNYQNEIKKLSKKSQNYVKKDKDFQEHIKKFKLDSEEIELLIESEQGERSSISNFEQEQEKLIIVAKNTLQKLQKKKQLTVRLIESDIIKLKSKAAKEGIPYQTLLGSILHKALL